MTLPTCQPPNRDVRPPRLVCPPGAIDCHVHVYGPEEKYPVAPTARFRAPDAPPAELNRVHDILGIDGCVLVQPSTYGTDNRRHLDAAAELGRPAKVIVSVPFDVPQTELLRLKAAGACGVRFAVGHPGGPSFEDIARLAERLAPLGLHVELHVRREPGDAVLARAEKLLRTLPVPLCLAHVASLEPGSGVDQPDVDFLRDWLPDGRCWVKLSGGYRISTAAPYLDVIPIVRELVAARPDRMLWGSDWPHVEVKGPMPETASQLDYLTDWIPDAAVRRGVLVENPRVFYGF